MIEEPREFPIEEPPPAEAVTALPFPHKQQTFCRYEPIEKQIEKVRVLVVDCLLRDEDDLSDVARSEWGSAASVEIKRERRIAKMAIENIESNLERLVKEPSTQVTPLASVAVAAAQFQPDAIRQCLTPSGILFAQIKSRYWRSAAGISWLVSASGRG